MIKKDILKNIDFTKNIFPPIDVIYRALELTPINEVKVVILGQDPYHGDGEANGLAFSVNKNVRIPPSLKNIFKELNSDLGFETPNHGDLTSWAKQGVLLLNSVLTVEKDKPASHKDLGWQEYTDGIIKEISETRENIVFIIWGKYAESKVNLIDGSKHMVIISPHPSPFSARKGFFGSKPFSRTNTYLEDHGIKAIDWEIK